MDNFIFLVVILELLLLWQTKILAILLFCIGYAWWYLDGKEYTGEGRSDGLRALSFWKRVSPVSIITRNDGLTNQTHHLYVFNSCTTIMPMFWAIGLHGTEESMFVPRHAINYLIPPIYMWIPVLRDFLKWTGAVTWSKFKDHHKQDNVIIELLKNGRSVAYSPSNFVLDYDVEHAETNYMPSDEVLTYCLQQQIKIVLVNVRHETKRYALFRWPKLQNWVYEKTGHYFPVLYWKKYGHQSPLIEVEFELEFKSGEYNSLESLKNMLKTHLQRNSKNK
jgi:hypothetical protein